MLVININRCEETEHFSFSYGNSSAVMQQMKKSLEETETERQIQAAMAASMEKLRQAAEKAAAEKAAADKAAAELARIAEIARLAAEKAAAEKAAEEARLAELARLAALPPCHAGWWRNGDECLQGCEINGQRRNSIGERICQHRLEKCGSGSTCIDGTCLTEPTNDGFVQKHTLIKKKMMR
jgi:hypothetical protein